MIYLLDGKIPWMHLFIIDVPNNNITEMYLLLQVNCKCEGLQCTQALDKFLLSTRFDELLAVALIGQWSV